MAEQINTVLVLLVLQRRERGVRRRFIKSEEGRRICAQLPLRHPSDCLVVCPWLSRAVVSGRARTTRAFVPRCRFDPERRPGSDKHRPPERRPKPAAAALQARPPPPALLPCSPRPPLPRGASGSSLLYRTPPSGPSGNELCLAHIDNRQNKI